MLALPDRARPIRLVDRSKGIARGLVCVGLFNQPGGAYDLMNGSRFSGTPAVGGLVAPSISSGAWHNKTLNAYTVCIWHGGFTLASWGAVVASNDGTNRWVWQRYSTTTTMRIYHNAGSHNFTDFTTSDCEVAGMLAMRWDGLNAHAFYNGDYLGYSLHSNSIGSTVTSTLGFGNATVYQALVYSRALSDAEIRRLYGDPAAPLERSRIRVAVLFLSTGGPQPLAGGIAGQSTVAAALAVARSLAGQVTAQGEVSGQVSVSRPLAASVQAVSQVAGAVEVEKSLSGAVEGQSGLSGTMSVTRALAGSVTAQAQAAGGLSATWALAGSLEAASAAAGILTIEGQVALAGQLTAASSCAAGLSVGRLLAGQVSGQTGVAGNLSLPGEQVALSGSISAQSGVSGSLRIHRGLAGQLASTANVSGAVSAMRSLSAGLGGTVQVVGQVRADWALAGSMAAQADVSGSLAILGEVNLAGVFLFLKRKTR